MSLIKSYVVTFIVFIILELFWLIILARDLYAKELGYIMKSEPDLLPAAVFGLLFVGGLVFFVVNPALEQNSWSYALFAGVFYGLITYATYTLTNLANLDSWPLKVSIIDLLWGMVLGGAASTISFLILNRLK